MLYQYVIEIKMGDSTWELPGLVIADDIKQAKQYAHRRARRLRPNVRQDRELEVYGDGTAVWHVARVTPVDTLRVSTVTGGYRHVVLTELAESV